MIELGDIVFLFIVGGVAGFVDAIAGGGGLLSIPALLWTGMSPIQAIATNKLQASMGSFTATANYVRHGLVSPRQLWFAVLMTLLGSMTGALLVQRLPNAWLETLVPVMLILIALYFLFSKKIRLESGEQRISLTAFSVLIGFTIGFYDGFFGPGTGSFFTIAFVLLLGYALPRAIGGTKLLNFTSNVVALGVFILSGHILWLAGIVMGSGQIIGSYLGSHLAVKHGARLIRPMLVTISILMSIKLLLD
ncbi:MAG: TSUP family transporter [Sedimenticolaceae bacterium]|nr:TSUP family transporter [Sedimenticolaceae bacterium]